MSTKCARLHLVPRLHRLEYYHQPEILENQFPELTILIAKQLITRPVSHDELDAFVEVHIKAGRT